MGNCVNKRVFAVFGSEANENASFASKRKLEVKIVASFLRQFLLFLDFKNERVRFFVALVFFFRVANQVS